MTTTTHERPIPAAIDAYLAAVGDALAGVPDSDRQELLDDLAEHLREMAPESDADLIERLGTPEQYAAELLASAGIEASPLRTTAAWRLAERARTVSAVLATPFAKEVKAFLPQLVPAWWVARAWIILAAIAARRGLREAIWIPNAYGNSRSLPRDLGLLLGAIVLSVWIGRGTSAPIDRPRQWASWILTAIGIIALVSLSSADRSYDYRVDTVGVTDSSPPGQLINAQGDSVTNVFAYDASGKPLGPVFLFDQTGAPLDVGNAGSLQENGVLFVSGLFPQPEWQTDATGTTRGVAATPPQVSIPRLPQPPEPAAPKLGPNKPKVTTPGTGGQRRGENSARSYALTRN